jgi:hypothetical protein
MYQVLDKRTKQVLICPVSAPQLLSSTGGAMVLETALVAGGAVAPAAGGAAPLVPAVELP